MPANLSGATQVGARLLDPRQVVGNLLRHRSLVRQLVRRDIHSRYRGSGLGLAWAIMQPLALLSVYTFVFGVVFRARWPRLADERLGGYAVVLFSGMLVLNFFNECVGRAPALILGAASYVKKVVFPLEILPVVALGSAGFHALINFAVLLVAHLSLGGPLHWTLLLTPLVALPLVMLTLGLSWFLASLGVFVRDVGQFLQLVLQALIFLTPVFYPLEALPDPFRSILVFNPLTPIVEDFRGILLWGRVPDWSRLAITAISSAVMMLLGYAWFSRTKRGFADVM